MFLDFWLIGKKMVVLKPKATKRDVLSRFLVDHEQGKKTYRKVLY